MIITQKIELVVSAEDAIILDSQSRICKRMYNKLLEMLEEMQMKKLKNLV